MTPGECEVVNVGPALEPVDGRFVLPTARIEVHCTKEGGVLLVIGEGVDLEVKTFQELFGKVVK